MEVRDKRRLEEEEEEEEKVRRQGEEGEREDVRTAKFQRREWSWS